MPALDVNEISHYARGRVDNARHAKADRLKRGVLLPANIYAGRYDGS